MDVDQNFTDEQLQEILQSLDENPKSIEQNPTTNDLIIPPPINLPEETSNKSQNLTTDLPTQNQSSALPPFNPNPIATQASNNQSNPISGAPVKNQNFAIPPLCSTPIPIKNDQNRPASNKRPAHLLEATQAKRPASSSPRPPQPKIFSFKLKPAGRFCDAIQALWDINLHAGKSALIEVDNTGFKVIVQDVSTQAMGILHLKSELLIEFRCAKRFQKLCSSILDSILMIFSSVPKKQYEDVLTVSCTEESQFLYFKLDGDHKGEAPAEIVEQLGLGDDELRIYKAGNVSNVACVAVIFTDVLKEIIPSMAHSDTVTVEMTSLNVMISIKTTGFSRNFEVPGGTGVPNGQKICSEFKFLHGNSLKKACSLSQMFTVGIQTSPNRVLLKFELENQSGNTPLHQTLYQLSDQYIVSISMDSLLCNVHA